MARRRPTALLLAFPLLWIPPLAPGIVQEPRNAEPEPRFGEQGYIEYVPGNAPLVLLAPHGGRRRPPELRDRREGVRLADSRTLELARELAAAFEERTGRLPHLVLCHLHRSKLDANRARGEAAEGDAHALQAWHAWHEFVEEARARIVEAHGHGLVIDVHGQSHPEGWIEWGYALSARQLALDDGELQLGAQRLGSSVDALARRHGGERASLLRGPYSLGGLTQARGYESVPSPEHPHPGGGRYFNGGYNTRRHGSRAKGEVDAVQMEVPRHLRLDSRRRKRLARDLAACLATYLERWYEFHPEPPEEEG